ncbi:CopD family protein [Pelagicoccus sp. SDUM812002]|uniref:CopD family protein n=1 Tax=Pelagicoccus sp. SDUM812002 TaxID=3041266 RepID=UPI00280E492F|nr:CopD family protein [Pelagicoccus sp. SDUM812002]MDQ8187104.1 CopD family protein [Pelagicoccus sp. SDUM812002]
MNIYGSLIVLHLLGACVWVGGHFLLAGLILPQAYRVRDTSLVYRIESAYASVGIPALLLEVSTGLVLAYLHLPELASWLDFSNPMGRLVGIKVILLLLTLALGFDVRYRLFPKVETDGLAVLKWHVSLITILSVLLVFVGASFRIGWMY